MSKERFANLTDNECAILFEALLFCIESATGIGFPRHDQGHPDYFDGATGRPPPAAGDTAETNRMFQMVQELSLRLADHPIPLIFRRYGITTWEHFCQVTRAAYDAHYNDRHHYVPLYRRAAETI
jgi:hypothetical protein